ncbi:MAG: PAS domain S-box protein, partial [archaeon]|nr:PAS domain S-box protein [archaeon]
MNLPDQKKYTEKISDNNNIFKIMCDESLISIYIIQDKLIKYVNKQASILCGYSLDEMHAWDLEEYLNVIHPEDLPFVMEQGRKKQEGNKSDIIERHSYRIITKLGKIKWVDNFSKTIYYDGKPANLVYLIDITKNKKSEDIFQKAFQLSPDIRAISRIKDSTIIDINDIFLKTIDISKEEIIGQKPLFLYKNPEDRIKFLEELNEKGRVTDFKLEFLTSKKENRVGICSSEMIEIGGEKCLYTNVRDITERKQTEENLKKTEQKYRDLIENIPGAVWETQSDGKTTFVSPNIEEMTGYSIEEILTDKISWFDMIHKEDLQTVQNAFDLLFLEGKKFDIEYRLLKNDGTLIWLHDRAWSTYSKEGIDYVRGIASDITERKKAEEELQKTMVKYKILINNILAHLTLYTLDGIILFMNDSAANSLGYSTEEVIGKSLFDLFPEQTSIFKERIEQIKQSKKGLIVEDSIKFFQGIEWFTSNL